MLQQRSIGLPRTHTGQRPLSLVLAAVLLGFLGITAVGGGVTMVADPSGGLIGMPAAWMEKVPLLDDWLVPGIVLASWFGLGSLLTLAGMIKRFALPGTDWVERRTGRHWTWLATIVLGATQVAWIGVELWFMPATMWIQALLLGVGLAMMMTMATRTARTALAGN